MWPWGHLAVGYLVYVAICTRRQRGEQTAPALVAVVFGSQLPDLVDKPLAWTFEILPSGRSLAHSLLTATVVLSVIYWATHRWGHRKVAFAFGVGWVTHSLGDVGPDVYWGLVHGDWSQLEWLTFLLWPVLQPPPYPQDSSFIEHFRDFALEPFVMVQFALFGVAVLVWATTGMTGVDALRRGVRRWV